MPLEKMIAITLGSNIGQDERNQELMESLYTGLSIYPHDKNGFPYMTNWDGKFNSARLNEVLHGLPETIKEEISERGLNTISVYNGLYWVNSKPYMIAKIPEREMKTFVDQLRESLPGYKIISCNENQELINHHWGMIKGSKFNPLPTTTGD